MLTQFNSASLNRHIAQTYRMDLVQPGLRRDPGGRADARQPELVSGHGRRRPPGGAPLRALRRRLLPDPRRRSSLPDGLLRAGRRAHRSQRRHHDRRAAGDGRRRVGDGHLPVRPQRTDRRVRGEAERASGSTRSARAFRAGAIVRRPLAGQAVRRLDGHLRVLARRAARGARSRTTPKDFGREIIPAALGRYRVNAYLFRGYWADVGTVESFYDANIMLTQPGAPFKLLRSAPADLHAPALPAGLAARATARCATRSSPKGCYLDRCDDRGVGRRHPHQHPGAARRSGDRCCSAPTSTRPTTTAPARGDRPRLGIGRDVVLDRVIVDKNARIGDGAQPGQRGRRPARRRRRLLHPRRRHHRAEGRGDQAGDTGLAG